MHQGATHRPYRLQKSCSAPGPSLQLSSLPLPFELAFWLSDGFLCTNVHLTPFHAYAASRMFLPQLPSIILDQISSSRSLRDGKPSKRLDSGDPKQDLQAVQNWRRVVVWSPWGKQPGSCKSGELPDPGLHPRIPQIFQNSLRSPGQIEDRGVLSTQTACVRLVSLGASLAALCRRNPQRCSSAPKFQCWLLATRQDHRTRQSEEYSVSCSVKSFAYQHRRDAGRSQTVIEHFDSRPFPSTVIPILFSKVQRHNSFILVQ